MERRETYINFYLLPVRIFYGWIVALYPHILYELGCLIYQRLTRSAVQAVAAVDQDY